MSDSDPAGPTPAPRVAAADTVDGSADATIAIPGGSAQAPVPETLLAEFRQLGDVAAVALPPLPANAYQIGVEVARGGMGRVVRAFDHRLGRVVALKLLLGDGPALRARFAREARITAGLQHPSIVPIYEAGTWPDGNLAYAMKLVSGESLEMAIVACTSLEERLALLPRFIDVVDAVAYAHSERVVHRDIKPSNIILGEFGETILIDWGVAKSLVDDVPEAPADAALPVDSDASRLTAIGQVVGTPVYMAPEQAAGDSIDEGADVYSLGAVLYHLLAGRLPYTGATPLAVLRKVALGPPDPLESIDLHIPPELVAVAARAMARARAERYSAAELAAELRRFTTGKLVAAYHYTARERLVRWLRRHRAPVLVGAAALALLIAVAAGSAVRIVRERDRAQASDRRSRGLVADQYAEQGRVLLLAGDRLRALAYLLAASEAGARGPALDFLLARAALAVDQKRHQLLSHAGAVSFVAIDASGKRVVTVSDDGFARLWDTASGREVGAIRDAPVEIVLGELAPSGEEVLTVSKSGAVHRWRFAPDGGGQRLAVGRGTPSKSARFGDGGQTVLTGGVDGRIRIFDRQGDVVAEFAGHEGAIRDILPEPSGPGVWTAGEDGVVARWTRDGRALARWPLARGIPHGLAASPDGAHVAAVLRDGAVAVWSAPFDRPPALIDLAETLTSSARWTRILPVFLAGGRKLAVPFNRTVQILELASGRRIASLAGHPGEVTSVAASPDGAQLASASADGGVRVWNGDGRLVSILPTADHAQTVALAPAGGLVATAGYGGAALWLPAPDPPSRALVGHRGSIYSVRFRRDGARLVTAGLDQTVRIWEVSSGREVGRLALASAASYAAYDPSGRRIVTAEDSGEAILWDADTGRRLASLAHSSKALMAADFSPDGRVVAIAGDDGDLRLFDASSLRPVATLDHPDAVNAFGFDPSGTRVVTAGHDGIARVWNVSAGQVVTTIPLDGPGLVASFSPDGAHVVVSARQVARIHDATSGMLVATLDAHRREVGAARLTAGGLALTGGYDHATNVWDVRTGRLLASYDGHENWILGVDVDPTGWVVASAGLDGVVLLRALPRAREPAQLVKRLASQSVFEVRDGLLVSRPVH